MPPKRKRTREPSPPLSESLCASPANNGGPPSPEPEQAVVNQRRVRGITRGVCIEKLGLLLMLVHLLARMHRWLHHPGLKFPKM
ncbi:hypothetical protein CIPAW_08G133900 [Carya illinoinensis]|uniref:Uncharacterized protein n=1 Tax=Carya illinoinensis TaxID=32201 RepID=A0A8T1PXU0_CARIL|nr:hypothetical protein CIPAW_08G133900 [Carya illinoinensis]